jgi:hypothetical protein
MNKEAQEARFDPRELLEQRGPLIEEVADFPIKPSDINATAHLYNAYGNNETEVSAGHIIRMCQEKGSWGPFTADEIEEFYHRVSSHTGFSFNQLVDQGMGFSIMTGNYPMGGGWIVLRDGKYHLTTTFVEAAFKSSPAKAQ